MTQMELAEAAKLREDAIKSEQRWARQQAKQRKARFAHKLDLAIREAAAASAARATAARVAVLGSQLAREASHIPSSSPQSKLLPAAAATHELSTSLVSASGYDATTSAHSTRAGRTARTRPSTASCASCAAIYSFVAQPHHTVIQPATASPLCRHHVVIDPVSLWHARAAPPSVRGGGAGRGAAPGFLTSPESAVNRRLTATRRPTTASSTLCRSATLPHCTTTSASPATSAIDASPDAQSTATSGDHVLPSQGLYAAPPHPPPVDARPADADASNAKGADATSIGTNPGLPHLELVSRSAGAAVCTPGQYPGHAPQPLYARAPRRLGLARLGGSNGAMRLYSSSSSSPALGAPTDHLRLASVRPRAHGQHAHGGPRPASAACLGSSLLGSESPPPAAGGAPTAFTKSLFDAKLNHLQLKMSARLLDVAASKSTDAVHNPSRAAVVAAAAQSLRSDAEILGGTLATLCGGCVP